MASENRWWVWYSSKDGRYVASRVRNCPEKPVAWAVKVMPVQEHEQEMDQLGDHFLLEAKGATVEDQLTDFILFVNYREEGDGVHADWWKKGVYRANSPKEVVQQVYSNAYRILDRRGNGQFKEHVAVVGIDVGGWTEFEVTIEAQPVKIVEVQQKKKPRPSTNA